MKECTDYCQLANHSLIAQAARYYNDCSRDMETYGKLNLPGLEQLTAKHLMHWKRELHNLIFNYSTQGGEI